MRSRVLGMPKDGARPTMCGLGRNVGRFGGEVRFGYDRGWYAL